MDEETVNFKDLVIAARARQTEGLISPNVIPTEYKGIKFRSKLEARWAVFFDTLGIEWQYEPQGYEIGTGYEAYYPRYLFSDGETLPFEDLKTAELYIQSTKEYRGLDLTILEVLEPLGSLDPDLEWYLPDFWLPGLEVWAEVKGKFGWEEFRTAVKATDGFSKTLPGITKKDLTDPRNTVFGLLYLGDIPNPDRNTRSGSHVLFRNRKGTEPKAVQFKFNHLNDRVELVEVNEVDLNLVYMGFDVYNCYSEESTKANYGDDIEHLGRAVTKGLPRKPLLKYDKWDSFRSYRQKLEKFLDTPEELFGEEVLKAGWAAARNYQFK
jgi:hypothetical protein